MRERPSSDQRSLMETAWVVLLPLLLFPAGSAKAQQMQVPDDGIARIIAHADEGAVAEVNRHDAQALAARFWGDAIDISPTGIVSGRPAIERHIAEWFKTSDPQDFAETIDKVEFSGDQGWLVGHWSDTQLSPDGSRHPAKGWVAAVLEKRDGQWKARVHVIALAQ